MDKAGTTKKAVEKKGKKKGNDNEESKAEREKNNKEEQKGKEEMKGKQQNKDKLEKSDKKENKGGVLKDEQGNAQGATSNGTEDQIGSALSLLERMSLEDKNAPKKVIDDLTFDGFLNHWKNKGFKNIITMVGAGISTSAGIPDFRTPGAGLYSKLEKYDLPHPTAIFEISFFLDNPKPFFALAKELYPGFFFPTPTHYFIRLLHEKGILRRHYTQNIDMLERLAGIPGEKLVEAHGTFYTSHCLECKKEYNEQWMKEQIFSDEMPVCDCSGVVKPDIVFYGENLNERFYKLQSKDFKSCDLLITMGTSLEVQPFASLIEMVPKDCLRVLINRMKVGRDYGFYGALPQASQLLYDSSNNRRDVAYIGDCDAAIWKICETFGWKAELETLIREGTKALSASKLQLERFIKQKADALAAAKAAAKEEENKKQEKEKKEKEKEEKKKGVTKALTSKKNPETNPKKDRKRSD